MASDDSSDGWLTDSDDENDTQLHLGKDGNQSHDNEDVTLIHGELASVPRAGGSAPEEVPHSNEERIDIKTETSDWEPFNEHALLSFAASQSPDHGTVVIKKEEEDGEWYVDKPSQPLALDYTGRDETCKQTEVQVKIDDNLPMAIPLASTETPNMEVRSVHDASKVVEKNVYDAQDHSVTRHSMSSSEKVIHAPPVSLSATNCDRTSNEEALGSSRNKRVMQPRRLGPRKGKKENSQSKSTLGVIKGMTCENILGVTHHTPKKHVEPKTIAKNNKQENTVFYSVKDFIKNLPKMMNETKVGNITVRGPPHLLKDFSKKVNVAICQQKAERSSANNHSLDSNITIPNATNPQTIVSINEPAITNRSSQKTTPSTGKPDAIEVPVPTTESEKCIQSACPNNINHSSDTLATSRNITVEPMRHIQPPVMESVPLQSRINEHATADQPNICFQSGSGATVLDVSAQSKALLHPYPVQNVASAAAADGGMCNTVIIVPSSMSPIVNNPPVLYPPVLHPPALPSHIGLTHASISTPRCHSTSISNDTISSVPSQMNNVSKDSGVPPPGRIQYKHDNISKSEHKLDSNFKSGQKDDVSVTPASGNTNVPIVFHTKDGSVVCNIFVADDGKCYLIPTSHSKNADDTMKVRHVNKEVQPSGVQLQTDTVKSYEVAAPPQLVNSVVKLSKKKLSLNAKASECVVEGTHPILLDVDGSPHLFRSSTRKKEVPKSSQQSACQSQGSEPNPKHSDQGISEIERAFDVQRSGIVITKPLPSGNEIKNARQLKSENSHVVCNQLVNSNTDGVRQKTMKQLSDMEIEKSSSPLLNVYRSYIDGKGANGGNVPITLLKSGTEPKQSCSDGQPRNMTIKCLHKTENNSVPMPHEPRERKRKYGSSNERVHPEQITISHGSLQTDAKQSEQCNEATVQIVADPCQHDSDLKVPNEKAAASALLYASKHLPKVVIKNMHGKVPTGYHQDEKFNNYYASSPVTNEALEKKFSIGHDEIQASSTGVETNACDEFRAIPQSKCLSQTTKIRVLEKEIQNQEQSLLKMRKKLAQIHRRRSLKHLSKDS